MSSFSCKGCDSRKPGCHATCDKYIAEKKAWDELQAQIRKKKNIEDVLKHQTITTMQKNKKRMGIQKPSIYGGQ